MASQKTMTTLAKTNNEKVLEASYLISYRVARAGEAHTIAETLIKPCKSILSSVCLMKKLLI